MNQLQEFITNHWQLSLTFGVLLVLMLINELISKKKQAKGVSPQTTVDMMNNNKAMVVDFRNEEAYKNGHILGAIHASFDDFQKPKMDKYKNKTLILVCDKGIQSQQIAAKISASGFQPLVLSGGMSAELFFCKEGLQ